MGVNLWEDGWREHTQREWTARQWEFQSLRGTPAGIAMALDFIGRDFTPGRPGYRLVEYVAPPQGFYASPKITPRNERLIRQMPELRVTPRKARHCEFGRMDCHDGFAGVRWSRDDGPALTAGAHSCEATASTRRCSFAFRGHHPRARQSTSSASAFRALPAWPSWPARHVWRGSFCRRR
jgi:hypothetical protein